MYRSKGIIQACVEFNLRIIKPIGEGRGSLQRIDVVIEAD